MSLSSAMGHSPKSAAPSTPQEWRWLLNEVRPYLTPQLAASGLLVLTTVLSLLDPLLMKWLIDTGLRHEEWRSIMVAIALLTSLYGLRIALGYASGILFLRSTTHMAFRLRMRLLRSMKRVNVEFFERYQAGDLARRIEDDVDRVVGLSSDLIPTFMRVLVTLFVALVFMLLLNWRLTFMALPVVPWVLWMRGRYRGRLEELSNDTRVALGRRSGILYEYFASPIQVTVLSAHDYFRTRIGRIASDAARRGIQQRRTELRYNAANAALVTATTCLMLAAGVYEVWRGALTLGGYIAFYSYLARLLEPVSGLVQAYAAIKRTGGNVRHIAELEEAADSAALTAAPTRIAARNVEAITCEGVGFSYTERAPVLRNVNVTLRRGEWNVLTGESGSGKSTLAKLLLGMREPDCGTIRLSESSDRERNARALTTLATFAPSDPIAIHGTLRENALLGCRGVDDSQLTDIARVAGFDRVVDRFADGWDHMLGMRGAGLSDGERQRLGIVRALVRAKPFLVLDEATGALDAATEKRVLGNLRRYATGRIVLSISHRPAAIASADRVYTLQKGALVEHAPKCGFLAEQDGASRSTGTPAEHPWLADTPTDPAPPGHALHNSSKETER